MKINSNAEEKIVPSWSVNNKYASLETVDAARLSKIATSNISENDLIEEMDLIEKCATSNSSYHYNSSWGSSVIDQLREFASVVGLKDFISVDIPSSIVTSSSNQMIRTAQTKETKEIKLSESLKNVWSDPFKIEERSNTQYMDKKNWQVIEAETKMNEQPSMDNKSVMALRGGENYNTNSDVKTAPGRNSITDPTAIEKLANDTTEDTGTRLHREKIEKEQAKKMAHSQWQQDLIDSMKHRNIVPEGKVFQTETLVVQSGLNSPSSQMGVYAKFDKNDIPEKTQGELIKEQNTSRKESIQRKTEKNDWEKPNGQNVRTVSDLFSEELKKQLGK